VASHAAHRGDEPAAMQAQRELDELEDAAWPEALRVYGLEARSHTTYMFGHFEETLTVARRMADIYATAGDSRGSFTTRMYIANITFTLGRYHDAVQLGRELRDAPRASRYDLYGIALLNLVEALLFAGETDEAERTARQLLAWRPPLLVGLTLCLSLVLAERGRYENAARLWGHGRRVYTDHGLPLEPAETKVTERAQTLLGAAMSAETLEQLAAEGARLDERGAFAVSGLA
jgi:tetratricopeptide (TPR) repeat protein